MDGALPTRIPMNSSASFVRPSEGKAIPQVMPLEMVQVLNTMPEALSV